MKRTKAVSGFMAGALSGPIGSAPINCVLPQGLSLKNLVLMVFLLAAAELCWAGPTIAPPPCTQALDLDQVTPEPPEGLGIDTCFNLSFNVPAVPANQMKTGDGGWGSLVIQFDHPIDGGAFDFGPDCLVPINGKLSDDMTQILLSPLLRTPRLAYGLGQTGTPSDSNQGNFTNIAITIMFDLDANQPNNGMPNLVSGYWKSKLTDFTYRPNPGDYKGSGATGGNIDLIYDIPLPEPPTLPLLCVGCALVLVFSMRRKMH